MNISQVGVITVVVLHSVGAVVLTYSPITVVDISDVRVVFFIIPVGTP